MWENSSLQQKYCIFMHATCKWSVEKTDSSQFHRGQGLDLQCHKERFTISTLSTQYFHHVFPAPSQYAPPCQSWRQRLFRVTLVSQCAGCPYGNTTQIDIKTENLNSTDVWALIPGGQRRFPCLNSLFYLCPNSTKPPHSVAIACASHELPGWGPSGCRSTRRGSGRDWSIATKFLFVHAHLCSDRWGPEQSQFPVVSFQELELKFDVSLLFTPKYIL